MSEFKGHFSSGGFSCSDVRHLRFELDVTGTDSHLARGFCRFGIAGIVALIIVGNIFDDKSSDLFAFDNFVFIGNLDGDSTVLEPAAFNVSARYDAFHDTFRFFLNGLILEVFDEMRRSLKNREVTVTLSFTRRPGDHTSLINISGFNFERMFLAHNLDFVFITVGSVLFINGPLSFDVFVINVKLEGGLFALGDLEVREFLENFDITAFDLKLSDTFVIFRSDTDFSFVS